MTPQERERAERLMMAALDEEISPAERAELEHVLAQDGELQAEWSRFREVRRMMSGLALRPPPDEVWERYWESVYNRVERGLGWLLAGLGALILLCYGGWWGARWLAAAPISVWVKIGVVSLSLGAVLLLISVAREKYAAWRRDPYREVQR